MALLSDFDLSYFFDQIRNYKTYDRQFFCDTGCHCRNFLVSKSRNLLT